MRDRTRFRSIAALVLVTSALAFASAARAQTPTSDSSVSTPKQITPTAEPAHTSRFGFLKTVATKAATIAVIGTAKGLDAVTGVTKSATASVDASACTGPLGTGAQCAHYVKTEIDKLAADSTNRPTLSDVVRSTPPSVPQLE